MKMRRRIYIIFWVLLIVINFITIGCLVLAQEPEMPPEFLPLDILPEETSQVTALREEVEVEVDMFMPRMIEMSDWMYYNPESGYQEFEASKMTAATLEKYGFEVKFGVDNLDEGYNSFIQELYNAGGLPTAYVAKYKGKEEHPVIAFIGDLDALRAEPKPFHGAGQNLQLPVAIGSAIALSKVMEKNKLPGSVWVVATPAENIPPPSKTAMVKAGVFDEVDIVFKNDGIITSVAQRWPAGISNCCMLVNTNIYDFHGLAAHAAGNPWAGHDAGDAARLFLTAIDMLREHSEPEFKFHSTITEWNPATNIVNPFVRVDQWIRNADTAGQAALDAKREQIDTIAKGVAMAAFCEVESTHYGDYTNGIDLAWSNVLSFTYNKLYGDAEAISDESGEQYGGWDESGYGGVNVPSVCLQAAVAGIPAFEGSSQEVADMTITPEAHRALSQMAKSSAVIALRLIMEPQLLAKITEEHKAWQEYGLAKGLITQDMIRPQCMINRK